MSLIDAIRNLSQQNDLPMPEQDSSFDEYVQWCNSALGGKDYTSENDELETLFAVLGHSDALNEYSEGRLDEAQAVNELESAIHEWLVFTVALQPDRKVEPFLISQEFKESAFGLIDDYSPENLAFHLASLIPEVDSEEPFNEYGILKLEFLAPLTKKLESTFSEDSEIEEDSKEEEIVSSPITSRPTSPLNTQESVGTVMSEIDEGGLDLSPSWQRPRVWNRTKDRSLIRSLLCEIPLPNFIIYSHVGKPVEEVVDGKQRLSAIHDYINGEFSFTPVKQADSDQLGDLGGFTLKDCSSKHFADLPANAKARIRRTSLQLVRLRNLTPQQIYEIFAIYNASGTRLNSAEIRNAAFQDHPVHKRLVELAGEQQDSSSWSAFTRHFRTVVGNSDPKQRRYLQKSILERYLGYSRGFKSANDHDTLGRLTTAKSIKAYLDSTLTASNVDEIESEITTNWDSCNMLSADWCIHDNKFHALKFVDCMILMRFALQIRDQSEAAQLVDSSRKRGPPANQNSKTIWQHHLESFRNFWNNLEEQEIEELKEIEDDDFQLNLRRFTIASGVE